MKQIHINQKGMVTGIIDTETKQATRGYYTNPTECKHSFTNDSVLGVYCRFCRVYKDPSKAPTKEQLDTIYEQMRQKIIAACRVPNKKKTL